jgi:HPt (histidine-containing phosphotransfer) domain-containing protein
MGELFDPSRPGDDAFAGNLDLSIMEQLLGLDEGASGLLEEMLVLYREDTPDRLKAMDRALAAGDMKELADVAHAIKGAASTMGAPKVRTVAAELEAAGRAGHFDREPLLMLEELNGAYLESVKALEAFLAHQKG